MIRNQSMNAKYKKVIHFEIVLLLIFTLFSKQVFAKDFTYKTVYLCGPVGMKSYSDEKFPTINAYQYYYIHKSDDGKIIIWNDFYQYTNFQKITYNHLYVQNGGTTSLKYSKTEGVEKYVLKIENHTSDRRTYEKTLLVNSSSGTFISRIKGYEPFTGVCNKIN